MWKIIDGQSFLDIGSIDRSEFKVICDKGLTLIFPRKNKWDWTVEEKWLRSIVVDQTGKVVSCAWPKFGNFGEFKDDTEKLKQVLENGGLVHHSLKEDGSLCVRSVIDGKVIMRTRGTLFGGESYDNRESYGERFLRVASDKYPKLLDPFWMPNVSLLLEYIGPDNAVVVRYKQADLIFLGGVRHNLSIIPWDEIIKIADEGQLHLVELKELPSNPLKLLEEIKDWKAEGVVARCCEDQVFVKVKSAWYLANHRMKYSMKYKTIVEFVNLSGITNEEELVAKFHEYDYDFEVIEGGKELYARYTIARNEALGQRAAAEVIFENAMREMNIILFSSESGRRKYFAQKACTQQSAIKTMLFCLYDGRPDKADIMVQKLIATEHGKSK